jgi:P27 family predicted phage terminase small subunit
MSGARRPLGEARVCHGEIRNDFSGRGVMSIRGRKPTPTNILKLRGTYRADRHGHDIPRPDPKPPRCPGWLDDEAKRVWKQVQPELTRLGILTCLDGQILACYCLAVAELRHATESLNAEGRFITVGDRLKTHPAVGQQRSAWKAVKEFAALLGCEPSGRVRLKGVAQAEEEEDELDRFARERS